MTWFPYFSLSIMN